MIATLSRWLAPIRAGTWWEYKIPILLGIAYATALAGGVSFSRSWPAILAGIAAIAVLAAYVCVINDITDDIECDREAGVRTLAVLLGPQRVALLVSLLIFPVEMAGLGMIAGMAHLRYALPLLLVYAAFQRGGDSASARGRGQRFRVGQAS